VGLVHFIILMSGCLLGFFLPGYFLSRLLESPAKWISSFLISLLLLFEALFCLQILHIPIHFASVFAILAALSILLGFLAFKRATVSADTLPRVMAENRWLWGLGTLISLLFVTRAFLSPLQGYDTYFRWNFLATQILKYGNFAFYPPLTPADFKQYFYVDSIPPMVQFSYWWLYASYGQAIQNLTGIFVVIQFFLLISVACRLTLLIGTPRSAAFAVGALLASPLFFWSVFLGQESGLTALSLSASLYFLVARSPERPAARVTLAALATAVGALSREYGVVFIVLGALAAMLLKYDRKSVCLFIIFSIAFTLPWYLRTWILTGNPFYSISIGGLFPVNPVHDGIQQACNSLQGLGTNTFIKLGVLLKLLLQYSPLQFTIGILAALLLFKKVPLLGLCSAAVVFIWLYSIGVTTGGYFWTLRVLNPAIVLLSIAVGLMLDQLSRTKTIQSLFTILLGMAIISALYHDLTIPARPGIPSTRVLRYAFSPNTTFAAEAKNLGPVLSTLKTRILSDDAYDYVGLLNYGVELVPVWSPEVGFVFDPAMSPQQIRNRLIQIGISAVQYDPRGLSSLYLSRAAFFSEDMKNWHPYKSAGHSTIYLLSPN
jgi:hypothetical protein